MVQVISIFKIGDFADENREKRLARCNILADSMEEVLPKVGDEVEGMNQNLTVAPGSVAITPAGDIAIMGNNREWGEWI